MAVEVRSLTSAWRDGEARVYSQRSMDSGMKSDQWILGRMRDAALVVVDELALREPTPPQFEATWELINARSGKPTIITSNLAPDALVRIYDDRTVSRICGGTIVEMNGPDRRLHG